MALSELTELLKLHERSLSMLLEAMMAKQTAIINSDYDLLETSILREERILQTVQNTERKRAELLPKLRREINAGEDINRIADLLKLFRRRLTKQQYDETLSLEKRIRELILKIRPVNEQNRFLIEHTRAFIKETVNALAVTKNKSLLDRKI